MDIMEGQSESIESDLDLNYRREYFSYDYSWNLPMDTCPERWEQGSESGENLLFDCAEVTGQTAFTSGKIFFKKGPLQGPGRDFEFYLFVREAPVGIFIVSKIPFPEPGPNESYQIQHELECEWDNGMQGLRLRPAKLDKKDNPVFKEFPEEQFSEDVIWYVFAFDHNHYRHLDVLILKKLVFHTMLRYKTWHTKPKPKDIAVQEIPELATANLLFSSVLSDMEIHCEDQKYFGHKLIIFRQSSVIFAMFSQPLIEKKTGKLVIEDFEPEIVEEFLRFIYTGKVTDLARNAVGLFKIADKYDVQALKQVAEMTLIPTLNNENVLERYELAKLLDSKELIKACVTRVKMNKESIWKTPEDLAETTRDFPELVFIVL